MKRILAIVSASLFLAAVCIPVTNASYQEPQKKECCTKTDKKDCNKSCDKKACDKKACEAQKKKSDKK